MQLQEEEEEKEEEEEGGGEGGRGGGILLVSEILLTSLNEPSKLQMKVHSVFRQLGSFCIFFFQV